MVVKNDRQSMDGFYVMRGETVDDAGGAIENSPAFQRRASGKNETASRKDA
jgi:hypothetical protein